MNDPPDQTAEFNAENLLSVGGITFRNAHGKYLRSLLMRYLYL